MSEAPSNVALDHLGPTRLFITVGVYDSASDAEVGDVIVTAERASEQGTFALSGAHRVLDRRPTPEMPEQAQSSAPSKTARPPSLSSAFAFAAPVLVPPQEVGTVLGEYAASGGFSPGEPLQARVTGGAQRERVVRLIERGNPGFAEWLDPPVQLWDGFVTSVTSQTGGELPPPGTVFQDTAPAGAGIGDYLAVRDPGKDWGLTGFARVAAPGNGTLAAMRVVAHLYDPLGPGSLSDIPALAEWHAGVADAGPRDLLAHPEIWSALSRVLLEREPALEPFVTAVNAQAGARSVANVLTARMPGYDPDVPSGKRDADLLDLQAEYRTMAIMLAAKAVKPPLAIGLFGEWGSGKSSFIQQAKREVDLASRLAAEEAKRRARSDDGGPQPEIAFHESIIQIEFNAWHYSEGDLWAGLVDHLFTSLRDELHARAGEQQKEKTERELKALLDELDVQKEAERAANRRMSDLRVEEDNAQSRIRTEQENLAGAETELADARHADVWAGVSLESAGAELKEALERSAVEHGYPGIVKDVHQLVALGRRVGDLGQRGEVVWRSLRRQGLRPWNIAFLAGIILATMALGPLLARVFSSDSFVPALSQGLALVAGGVTWIRRRAGWLEKQLAAAEAFLDQVDAARTRIELEVRKNEASRDVRISKAEARLARVRNALEAAERAHAEARRQQIQLISQIEERLPERRMADFIEERANSKDYREKLGIMAIIRRDFERLSDLLAPPPPDDGTLSRARQEVAQARHDSHLPRIDRIILYIDDLDRCAPRKVVEVLRAVHLLLAFPLFMVVVAVDPRWVSRSLEISHQELLLDSMGPDHGHDQGERDRRPVSQPTRTTAIDYLEKIFQVPYWVPEFSPRSSQRMLRGLLAGQLDYAPAGNADAAGQPDRASALAELDRTLPYREEDARRAREVASEPDLSPSSLLITEEELRCLVRAAPMAGKSPRQVKQLTNLYRLVKVSLGESELDRLLGKSAGTPGCASVTLLLAVAIGAAAVADDFFDRITSMTEEQTLADLLDAIEAEGDAGPGRGAGGLAAVVPRIREILPEEPLRRDDLLYWRPAVRRYTFASGSLT